MAKPITKSIGEMFKATLALVFWYLPRNCREETKLDKDLARNMIPGWDSAQGTVPVESIETASKREGVDYVSLAVKQREEEYAALKADTTAEAAVRRQVFESLYLGKDGKIVPPKYIANACYRRSLAYREAQVLRRQNTENGQPKPLDVLDAIPCELWEYASELDRIAHNIRENERKREGFKPLTWKEQLKSGKPLFQQGFTDSDFRDTFSSGIGQKIYNLYLLDKRFPNVHIYSRLLLSVDSDQHVPWGPISTAILTSLNRRCKADKLKPGESQTTEDEVSKYFADVTAKEKPQRVMNRKQMEKWVEQSPNPIIAAAVKAVMEDNTDEAAKFVPLSEACEMLVRISELGGLSQAEEALKNVLSALLARKSAGAVQPGDVKKEQVVS